MLDEINGHVLVYRVIVIEDEWLVATLLSDMLTELGHVVLATAADVQEALDAVEQDDVDLVFLDLNLGGERATAVIDLLLARGVPFACTTGYGEDALEERLRDRPILQKPFELRDIERVIAQALPSR